MLRWGLRTIILPSSSDGEVILTASGAVSVAAGTVPANTAGTGMVVGRVKAIADSIVVTVVAN